MKKYLVLFSGMLLMQVAAVSVFAQKAGDVISGTVSDSDGPMMLVNVCEKDSKDSIVAVSFTDIEGEFSFRLVNPKDRLYVSYVGYETVDIPIDRLSFDIKMMDERLKVIGKRTVYPSDRGMVGKGSYLDKLLEYAPQDYVCGYIMRNAWNKNLWGIFLVKDGNKYSLVYRNADSTKTAGIKSILAKELEASVNSRIADIEYAVNNPVEVDVYEGLDEVAILYDGDVAFAVTPEKTAHFWSWDISKGENKGINDEIWEQEIVSLFK